MVTAALAGATLVLTRQQLIDSREQAAAAFAVTNATRLSNQLTFESTVEDLAPIVDSMTKIEGSQRLIRIRNDWLPSPELDREDLLERVWARDYFDDERLVDVHVRRLRTKIDPDPANPRYVVTVRGMGYKLQP